MNEMLLISRGDTELGRLSEDDVLELLRIGFLIPTDTWIREGMTASLTLSDLKPDSLNEPLPTSVANKMKNRIVAARNSLTGTASQTAKRLKQFTGQSHDRVAAATSQLLISFAPQIKTLVAEQLIRYPVQTIQSALRDDTFMEKLFGATYDCLPKPVCRFISEQAFVQFCVEHKHKLLPSTPTDPEVGR
ncbi:MAG: hypothetical protein HOP33_23325 [Verrucomicrobia bacterium]|nr:hypothetical protein [Verrucomicrobiota bacterium]